MAPRKSKTDAPEGSKDAIMLLEYLREQNRPYSAIDVSANLHNKVTKGQAAKLLRELHQNGEIEGKTAGKQTVYHALQNPSQTAIPEAIAALDKDIEKCQDELASIKAAEKEARAALAVFEAKPRLSQLRQDIHLLEEERVAVQARLQELIGGDDDDDAPMPPEERARLEQEWKQWQRHATTRRRICRELWGRCTEVLPENTTAQELWESLGLEGMLQ